MSVYGRKDIANTWTGQNLWYGDTWFYGGVNIVNQSIKQYVIGNGSSGIELKNIANVTIGSWIDANGTANIYTNGKIGVGVASPSQALQVDNGNVLFRNTAGNEIVYITANSYMGYGAPNNDVTYNHQYTGSIYSNSIIVTDGGFYGDGSNINNVPYSSLNGAPDLSVYGRKDIANTWTGQNLWYGDTWCLS